MSYCLFVSDLHIHQSRPKITGLFLDFLRSDVTRSAQAIYILGDLFEFWPGDDARAYPEVVAALKQASHKGPDLYFMAGNRDFLVGQEFAQASGCQLIPDPTVIMVDHEAVLLMHGDTLCTDDHQYQAFRAEVRSAAWVERSLSMPLAERLQYFQSLRDASELSIQDKTDEIMDVNQAAVQQVMADHDCSLLIHGHTHRQAVHQLSIHSKPATRIVLGDWYESGNVLRLDGLNSFEFLDLQP